MLRSKLEQLILNWQAEQGKRLTVRELSEATGLAVGVIARYKAGQVDRIYSDTAVALCRFFQCGLCDLLALPEETEAAGA